MACRWQQGCWGAGEPGLGHVGAVGAGCPPFSQGEGPGTVRCRRVCAERVWWGVPEREPSRCHYSLCNGDRRAAGDTSRLGDTGRPGRSTTRTPRAAPQLRVRCSGPRASPQRWQKGLCLHPCCCCWLLPRGLGAPGGRADVPWLGCDTSLRPPSLGHPHNPLAPPPPPPPPPGAVLPCGRIRASPGCWGIAEGCWPWRAAPRGSSAPARSDRVQAVEAPTLGGRRKVKRMRARAEIPAAGLVRCGEAMRGSQPRLQLGGVPVMRSGSVGWGWGGPMGTITGWFGGDLLLWVGLEVSGGKAQN
ncbi:uncharacterized protein LOC121078345 [Cygnus olor]|uniref:uncharacterized protein LOC121078345 n=1 Tax=Cygnus olor TaxID=8869 RepID=UPI001ADDFD16|nr:uncharacterized protein LOC121078345 [Cygnus olor]XP_040430380.1 uncharacterized protein LOC121078345 [Cygnus olor]XP_040430381.1 uncharacterized protein LOC121078345 [Cygnus olor]XP_040430382.1 uncharacterized protein LOC121078345 [Cygnus olor]XP_040430383.1 uncharacterized protein LOC121078345 [Cygnus olor]XP_040430384.1 uncharacterized protein LOC121078345 [Cygnus olor]XP_040430385.1 uncharacterized protein LOC121078345 [Cygnus olor]XP_040430386.1 uncharacterized protein LOC121078345 [